MAPARQHSDGDTREFKDDIVELFSWGNPNPNRDGCPTRQALIAVVERARPLGDPAYEHLVQCSPCYRDFKAIRANPAVSAGVQPTRWLATGAAMLLVLTGRTARWFSTHRRPVPKAARAIHARQVAELRSEVDAQVHGRAQ